MKNIGIFYGSTTGNTERVAIQLVHEFGEDIAEVCNVSKIDISDTLLYPNLVFGCSTWGMGDLQANFESFLQKLKRKNLERKKIAIFGCGDQLSYPTTFADSIGIIYEALSHSGGVPVGKITVQGQGYTFASSKASVDNILVGLPLDEINQSELTSDRIKQWVAQLKLEFCL